MTRLILLFFCCVSTLTWAAPSADAATPGPAQNAELTRTIEALDLALFDALFNRCDVDALAPLIAEDLEFFHDKHGLTAGKKVFLDGIAGMCERQRTGEDYRARRELVAESSEVYPMNAIGALHVGVHRFYMLKDGEAEKLVEVGRFANLWQQQADGHWQLRRVFSYDHRVSD
ncbi:MAG: nuclear transport factor 2 family protein [Lysobacterales bacterium]